MSKNFSSVVKLLNALEASEYKEAALSQATSSEGVSKPLQCHHRTVTLPSIQPLPLSPSRSAPLQAVSFNLDHVFTSDDTQATVYNQSVKNIVESCLLGYHGTVISFGTECGQLAPEAREREDFVICRAAKQIFRCLKKSRRSTSSSSTSNLVMLCSSVVITQEKVHDLLFGYLSVADTNGEGLADDELPPNLSLVNGSMVGASQLKVTGGKVAPILKYGREMERKVLELYWSLLPARDRGSLQYGKKRTHHTVFTLSVEYSQFGSMNSPVSGNLTFVGMAPSNPLTNRQLHTTGDQVELDYLSLFTFADIITSLTVNAASLEDSVRASGSSYNVIDEVQSSQLPCVPESMSKELYQNSVLTQLLQDSLGGNCKTLLITYIPEFVLPVSYGELYEALKIASRARLIQNVPNKRDLAEKALMSAYMRGLQEMYGQGVLAKPQEKKPRNVRMAPTFVTHFHGGTDETKRKISASKDSISSGEIDTAYDEMINLTEGEKRQQNVEMAATALVAAALEDKEKEDGEGGDVSDEEEDSNDVSSDEGESKPSQSEGVTPLQAKVRLKNKVDPCRAALLEHGALESASVSSFTERDVTIDALINIIQDPDKGVPRPPTSALKDVQIKRDAGSIFSGAELVRWMVNNIDGVENEGNAEILGQLLLDKGALFHSEGSKVFANADTLFYYPAFARPTKKFLSLDEIKRLLSQATGKPEVQSGDVTRNVTVLHREEEEDRSNGEIMIVTDLDREDIEDTEDCLDHGKTLAYEAEVAQHGTETTLPHQDKAVDTKQEEPVTVEQEMLLQEMADGEVCGSESSVYICHQDGQDTTDYECHLQLDEEVEQAQAELLKKQEEDLGQPNTVAQEHIPSVQTLEKTTDYPHPLHMAVAIGKSPGVVRQLVMMFGVNKRDEYNRTPLMFAALGNNKNSSCRTLIECGAEADRQDICGLTALHVACYHGNKAAASVLLGKQASVCLFDNTDHSAYHWSTVPDDHSCLQLLMSVATPELVMYADRWGLTALHWAISYDHSDHLKLLLKLYKEPLKHDNEGRTLLIYAVQQQAMQCIKVLLFAHPSLITAADAKGASPLHHASVQKSPELLELLLSHKLPKKSKVSLDINCKNHSGCTPLHCAVAYNQLQNITLLVSRGAHIGATDDEGRSSVDYANDLGEGDRELVLAALQNESGVNESSELNTHTSSKVCIIL